jgi:integrase
MLQHHMRRVRGELGIEHLTPHTLRHTYLTILNENGITGFDLAEIAGHKNLSTTRLYVHPTANDLSRKVEAIQTRIGESR